MEEYKYFAKEEKIPDYITDDMKISSDGLVREDSIKENSDGKSSNKENYNEENWV